MGGDGVSILWRAAWTVGTDETKDEFVELAREGEALLVALGGARPFPAAANLTNASGGDAFSAWTDAYASSSERVNGMPLGVLFAGVSGWDPRGDALVQRMLSSSTPTWNVVTQEALRREVPAAVARELEWFAARGPGLASGNELQTLQERTQRGWWWEYLNRLPRRQPAPPPPPPPPPPE